MKTMRKVLSVLLVLAMVLSLGAMAVSAADPAPEPAPAPTCGKIIVNNPHVGANYVLFKIFDLTTSRDDTGKINAAYTITANGKNNRFIGFIQDGAENEDVPFVLTATTTDGVYNVELKPELKGKEKEDLAREKIKNFLKAHQGDLHGESTDYTVVDAGPLVIDVSELGFGCGYYYLFSDAGTEVIIANNHEDVTINEKNIAPTVDKEKVTLDGSVNVGDSIPFRITIKAQKGAKDYKLIDQMTKGLTYNEDLTVSVLTESGVEELPAAGNYNVTYTAGSGDVGDNIVLEFSKTYLDTIQNEVTIYVDYTAVLNADAITVDEVNNTAKLEYGENSATSSTPTSSTDIYTYGFTLNKTDAEAKSLDGAKFKLYREVTNENSEKENQEVALIFDESDQNLHFYRPTVGDETAANAIVTDNGLAHFKGLALGTYYLEETEAPAGYNKLTHLVKVELVAGATDGSVVVRVYDENGTKVEEMLGGVVTVVNNTGDLLPSTGGMGTTMFYVLGAVLVLGAAILLVAKRRVREQ